MILCKRYWFFLLFLFLSFFAKAQNTLPILAEPEIKIKVKTEGSWSYDFGISHRNLIYSEDFLFEEIQMELAHTTNYALSERDKIGFGVKYRFRGIFDKSRHNELRFLLQYGHSVKYTKIKTNHRFRFEQRFRENTIFRTRYKFSAFLPLSSEEKERKWFLGEHTEFL